MVGLITFVIYCVLGSVTIWAAWDYIRCPGDPGSEAILAFLMFWMWPAVWVFGGPYWVFKQVKKK